MLMGKISMGGKKLVGLDSRLPPVSAGMMRGEFDKEFYFDLSIDILYGRDARTTAVKLFYG